MKGTIPIVLFTYARPDHLARVLSCLRENAVPLLYVFADAAKGDRDAPAVAQARALVRAIDWTETHVIERSANQGLGRNILAGIDEVVKQHDSFIVWEDDLICLPGTYAWLCAALCHYAADERVMSVTGWTHPRVTPPGTGNQPYFDGRAECWVWGAYARSWRGMDEPALEKRQRVVDRGIPAAAYGADLPVMAQAEATKNIWAVRWIYHHLQHRGLCLRPPWSLVEHIGFDAGATNAEHATDWRNPILRPPPAIPEVWPEPREQTGCRALWAREYPEWSWTTRGLRWGRHLWSGTKGLFR